MTAVLLVLEWSVPAEAGTVAIISRFTLSTTAPVFGGGRRNWTRGEFFVFEQVTSLGR